MYTYILNSYYYSSYVFKCLCMYVCIYTQTPFLINITRRTIIIISTILTYCSMRGSQLVRRKKNYKHPWKHRYQHDSGGSYSLSVGSNSYFTPPRGSRSQRELESREREGVTLILMVPQQIYVGGSSCLNSYFFYIKLHFFAFFISVFSFKKKAIGILFHKT